MRTFETEYQLKEWREVQQQHFDSDNKAYTGQTMSLGTQEQMLKLINQLANELIKNKVMVCEDHSANPTEFGISFTGYNPESGDYFKMIDCETADRLCNYLNNL